MDYHTVRPGKLDLVCFASATYSTCVHACGYLLLANAMHARQIYAATAIKSGRVTAWKAIYNHRLLTSHNVRSIIYAIMMLEQAFLNRCYSLHPYAHLAHGYAQY